MPDLKALANTLLHSRVSTVLSPGVCVCACTLEERFTSCKSETKEFMGDSNMRRVWGRDSVIGQTVVIKP